MKKILIISYYWPPNTGSGVQRWLKFSKYLLDFGWKPIIVTPENPYIELKDNEQFKNFSILRFGTIFGVSKGMRCHTAV